jgi:squalene-hopene/tetraprenyl-beta-curcumene cyclase
MKQTISSLAIALTVGAGAALVASTHAPADSAPAWSPRAAAAYLDGRMEWWLQWPNAQRDHDTACVSCHTAVPYALARPALRGALGEHDLAAPERRMIDNVVKRVRMWKDVEPFYPDQTRGLPKTSESRGTESVMNALILATRDANTSPAALSEDARQALANMWALQFRAGDQTGAWAWLNFHYEPWEGNDSAFFGASLAAVAVGTAPGEYAKTPDIQDRVGALRTYLQKHVDDEIPFNQLMALWASAKIGGVVSGPQAHKIFGSIVEKQQEDGGWATAAIGGWKRVDGSATETASDGYATGLVVFAARQTGLTREEPHLARAIAWLERHQDGATGMWRTSSPNKQRDPASDAGKFLSDAGTAFATLALTQVSSNK